MSTDRFAMRLALYHPDIPPNAGTILRLGACMGVAVDVIEPCGFPFSEKSFRRAAMDYLPSAEIVRHSSWRAFVAARRKSGGRIVLLTTRAPLPYAEFTFRSDDTLLLGQESAGVPEDVRRDADAAITVPMVEGVRSLNVAVTAAMVLGEALRQTAQFPARPGQFRS